MLLTCVGRVWKTGEHDEAVDRNGYGDNKVDDEQPLPASEAVRALEVGNDAALHNAREERAELGRTGEDGRSTTELAIFVPCAEDILPVRDRTLQDLCMTHMSAGESRCFEDALNEAQPPNLLRGSAD